MIGDLLAKDRLIDPAALQAARAANDSEATAYQAARVAEAARSREKQRQTSKV
ncbi:MAG: hypothetical protein ACUVS4_08030 [Chloroflexaceae bacterium]